MFLVLAEFSISVYVPCFDSHFSLRSDSFYRLLFDLLRFNFFAVILI